jgi:hypothetical protein
MSRSLALLAVAASAAALGYLGYVAVTWYRYGRTDSACASDPLLDRFFPGYEVRECHDKRVQAPASLTLATAKQISFRRSPVVRGIFALRSIPSRLRGTPQRIDERGILQETLSLGWGVLAETPGREIVMGAVTQPWKADVVFRALPPERFAAFAEPGYVKIAWTLRADPIGSSNCVFRTETRVIATDAESRRRFRRYWAFLSPGILIIRYEILRLLKMETESLHDAPQRSRAGPRVSEP